MGCRACSGNSADLLGRHAAVIKGDAHMAVTLRRRCERYWPGDVVSGPEAERLARLYPWAIGAAEAGGPDETDADDGERVGADDETRLTAGGAADGDGNGANP